MSIFQPSHHPKPQHPLLQPRMLALVGLSSCWGSGIGFMLARILIGFGFVFSLLSSLAMGWLYVAPISRFFHKAPRKSSTDPSRTEIIIAVLLIVATLLVPIVLFFQNANEDLSNALLTHGARIDVWNLPPERQSDGTYTFPLEMNNSGDLPAIDYLYGFGTSVTDHILSRQEENDAFDRFFENRLNQYKNKISTLPDSTSQISLAFMKKITDPSVSLSPQKYKDYLHSKLYIYNFFVVAYTDDNAKQHKIYFYGDYCERYSPDPRFKTIECATHNTEKKILQIF